MQLQVIRNLELSIQNIHIVYEDKSTKPNHPFALGITLNYIKLHVGYNFKNFSMIGVFFSPSRQQLQIGNRQS
jgi:hypothetical protein